MHQKRVLEAEAISKYDLSVFHEYKVTNEIKVIVGIYENELEIQVLKDYLEKETKYTMKQPENHGQDSKKREPREIDRYKHANTRYFYMVAIVIALISLMFVGCIFIATEGEIVLTKETGLSESTKKKHFVLFIVHYNKSYLTEEHKIFRMAVYHQNHHELILRNLKNMGITAKAHSKTENSVNIRELTNDEMTSEDIAVGTAWNE